MKKFLLTLTAVVALTAASRMMVVSAEEMAGDAAEAVTNEVMNNEVMSNETNAVSNETEETAPSSEGMAQ